MNQFCVNVCWQEMWELFIAPLVFRHCSETKVPEKFNQFRNIAAIMKKTNLTYYAGAGTALHWWRECTLNDYDLDFFVDIQFSEIYETFGGEHFPII